MNTFRIPIADDHEVVRRGIRALLEGHPGWEVCGEAHDGREAVELAKELKPDAVLLDIGMVSLFSRTFTRCSLQVSPRYTHNSKLLDQWFSN